MSCKFDSIDKKYPYGSIENNVSRKLLQSAFKRVSNIQGIRPFVKSNKFKILNKSKGFLESLNNQIKTINEMYNPNRVGGDIVKISPPKVVEIDVVNTEIHEEYIKEAKQKEQSDELGELQSNRLNSVQNSGQSIYYNYGDDIDDKVPNETLKKAVKNFLKNNADISTETIEAASKRLGREIDARALVDLMEMMIAYNKGEDVSLTEEILHIIVEDMHDSKLVQELESNSTFKSSPAYSNFKEFYYDKYSKDFDLSTQDGIDALNLKVNKEVLTKILKETVLTVSEIREEPVYDRFKDFIKRFWNRLQRLFNKKIEKYDREQYKKIRELYGEEFGQNIIDISKDFINSETKKIDVEKIKKRYTSTKDSLRLRQKGEKITQEINKIKNTLSALKMQKEELEKKKIGINQKIQDNPDLFGDLVKKYGKDSKDLLAKIFSYESSQIPLTPFQQRELDLLRELILDDEKDLKNKAEINKIARRIGRINKSLKKGEKDLAILFLVLGVETVDPQTQNITYVEGIYEEYLKIDALMKAHRDPNNSFQMGLKEYNDAVLFLKMYIEPLKEIKESLKTNKLDTLTKGTQKFLKDEIDAMLNKEEEIDDFLTNEVNPYLIKQIYFDLENKFPGILNQDQIDREDMGKLLQELGLMQRYVYSRQTGKELIFKDLVVLLEEIQIQIQYKTSNENKRLMGELEKYLGGYTDSNGNKVEGLRRSDGDISKTLNKFIEIDSEGSPTHHWLTDVRTTDWDNERVRYFDELKDKMTDYSNQEFREITYFYKGETHTKTISESELKEQLKKVSHLQMAYQELDQAWQRGKRVSEGRKLTIPKDKNIRNRMWSEAMLRDDAYSKWVRAVGREYNKQKALWFLENTQAVSNSKEIIDQRKNTMSKSGYAAWERRHIVKLRDFKGTVIYEYYKGELMQPSKGGMKNYTYGTKKKSIKTKDWTNPEFDKLNPSEKAVLKILIEKHKSKKAEITNDYDWETMTRLPQITNNYTDIAFNSRGIKDFFNNTHQYFRDLFREKDDEAIHANRNKSGDIIRTPPKRFMGKVKKPADISRDLIGTVSMFNHMANNFTIMSDNLLKINSIENLIKNTKVKDKKGNVKEGVDSNLYKRTLEIINDDVFGEKTLKVKGAKTLQTGAAYMRALNLKFNLASQTTGLLSSVQDFMRLAVAGRQINKGTATKALGIFTANMTHMLTDFQSSRPSNKYSLMLDDMGLVTSIQDLARNKNIGKGWRGGMDLVGWGGWKATDMPVKTASMVGMAMSIIVRPDKSFTTEARLERELKKLSDNYGKGAVGRFKRRFKKGEKFFEKDNNAQKRIRDEHKQYLTVHDLISQPDGSYKILTDLENKISKEKDAAKKKEYQDRLKYIQDNYGLKNTPNTSGIPKINYSKIPLPAFNYWNKSSKSLASRADKTKTTFTGRGIDKNPWLNLITLFSEWLKGNIERMFKEGDYNIFTEQYERGYFRAFGKHFNDIYKSYDTFESLITKAGKDWDSVPDETKEAFAQFRYMILSLAVTSALAFVVIGYMFSYEEEDEENMIKYFLKYMLIRQMAERVSEVSPFTAKEFVDNTSKAPWDILKIADTPFSIINIATEGEKVERGLYEGYDKESKMFIKVLPGVKGLYENYAGGYINEMLDKPQTTVGVSFEGKSKFIQDLVLNKQTNNVVSPFYVLPDRLGKGLGIGVAKTFSDYESKNSNALPTKKLNKDNE